MYVYTNAILDYEARLAASKEEQQRLIQEMEQNELMQEKCKQLLIC